MDTLPYDVLRLLPQWFTWPEYIKLLRVCRLWRSIYSLPEEVLVYAQGWVDGEIWDARLTVTLGYHVSPPPIICHDWSFPLRTLRDWRGGYFCGWLKIPLKVLIDRETGRSDPWHLFYNSKLVRGKDIIKALTEYSLDGSLYLISSKQHMYGGIRAMNYAPIGPLIGSSIPPLPSEAEIDRAFIQHMILDIIKSDSIDPRCKYPAFRVNSNGEWWEFSCSWGYGRHVITSDDIHQRDTFIIIIILNVNPHCDINDWSKFIHNGATKTMLQRIVSYALKLNSP